MNKGGKIATGIGSGAASGASMGSVAGPWGTVIGGVLGAAAGGIGAGLSASAEEELEKKRLEEERRIAEAKDALTTRGQNMTGINMLADMRMNAMAESRRRSFRDVVLKAGYNSGGVA